VEYQFKVNGVLVGPGYAEESDEVYLVGSIKWLSCYHYELSIDEGVVFKESCGWYSKARTKEKFKPDKFNLDNLIEDKTKDAIAFMEELPPTNEGVANA
jgi:hypothetical protein